MPRTVKGPDGVIRQFPDDATDAEIASALEGTSPAPPMPLLEQMGQRFPGGYEMSDSDSPEPSSVTTSLQSVAHPQSLRDLLPLLVPNAAGLGGEMLNAWYSAAKRAWPNAKNVRSVVPEMLKVLARDAMESPFEAANRKLLDSGIVDRYMPNIGSGSKAVAQADASAFVPKPHFTAQDVMRVRAFMRQGVSEADAIEAALKLKGASGDAMSQLLASPSFAKLNR